MEPLVLLCLLPIAITIVFYLLERFLGKGKIQGLPEPPGNTFFGHALKMGTGCLEKTLLDWKLKYGPVFQVRVVHQRLLILGSKMAISECFSLHQASGRPRVGVFQFMFEKLGEGPVLGEGPEYDEQRQFFMKALPIHGDDRRKLEASLDSELRELMEDWRNREGQVVNLDGITATFAINSFWTVLGGKKYSFEELRQVTSALERILGSATPLKRMQFLFHKIFLKMGLKSALDVYDSGMKIVEISLELINEHEKTRSPGNPRDMIDKMLDKRDKTTNLISAYHPNDAHQAFRLTEFWAASTETATRTIEYLILLMSQHPEVVSRVRQEILDVIGLDQEPQLCHWSRMPFVVACINEVIRLFPAGFIGIPHKALQDFKFRGSTIPKGTLILANIWGVNNDPEVWVRPEEFNPARFLNSEGNLDATMRSQVVSFSLGRRQCPGQQMSLDAIFLFMVTTLRHFDFKSVGPVDFGFEYGGSSIAPKRGNQIRIVQI